VRRSCPFCGASPQLRLSQASKYHQSDDAVVKVKRVRRENAERRYMVGRRRWLELCCCRVGGDVLGSLGLYVRGDALGWFPLWVMGVVFPRIPWLV